MSDSSLTKKIALLGMVIMFCSFLVGAPSVHAQAAAPAAPPATPATTPAPAQGVTMASAVGCALGVVATLGNPSGCAAGAAAAPVVAQAVTNPVATAKTVVTGAAMGLITDLLGGIVSIVGFLLGIAGELFNWVIVVTVFQYAAYFGNSAGMLIAWGILRDLGNILLLFGFIFMGICTILDIQSFSAKKALPSLLIFAVLLNFSLFAGEVVVDGANLLSASLFQQAGTSATNNTAACGSLTSASSMSACANVGIAGQIMLQSGLATVYKPSGVTTPPNQTSLALTYAGMIVLMGVVMVVLLAGAVMFFTRAIMLTLLLILSPIGFAGMAIPPLQGMANEWWKRLISNAIFAPVFLLLIYISLKIMSGVSTALGGSNATLATALSTPGTAASEIFIVFALVIGFFVAALMFARTSGVAGAQFATSFAQKTVLAPVNATRRLAGVGARETIGRGAASANNRYNQFMGNHKGIATTARILGIDSGVQGGLKGISNAKFGANKGFEESRKDWQHRSHELEGEAEKIAHAKELKTALGMKGGTPDEIQNRDVAVKAALDKMSKEEREQTPYMKKAADGIDLIVRNLSQKDYAEHLKSADVSHSMKDHMKDERFSPANVDRTIRAVGNAVADLGGGTISKPHVLAAMQPYQLAALDPGNMDTDTLLAVKAYLSTNSGTSQVQKFEGMIGARPGFKVNNNAEDRWNGFYP